VVSRSAPLLAGLLLYFEGAIMPNINGRYVPDWHADAMAFKPVAEKVEKVEEVEELSEPKRATRKRKGKTVETAAVDITGAETGG
jgi:hypothetical protein